MTDNVVTFVPRKSRWTPSKANVLAVYDDERPAEEIAAEWQGLTVNGIINIRSGKTYVKYTDHHANKRAHNPDRLKGAALSKRRERTLTELVDYAIEHYGFIPQKHHRFAAKFLATHFNTRQNNPSSHVTKFKETVVPAIADTYVEQNGHPYDHLVDFMCEFHPRSDAGELISVSHCLPLIEHYVPSWPEGVGRSIMFTVLYLLQTDRTVSSKQWRSVCIGLSRLCRDEGHDHYVEFFERWLEQLDQQAG